MCDGDVECAGEWSSKGVNGLGINGLMVVMVIEVVKEARLSYCLHLLREKWRS